MNTDSQHCHATDGRFTCTKPGGHDGPHIAYGIRSEVIEVWS